MADLTQRLIALAKGLALVGILVLGFLWIVSLGSEPAPEGEAAPANLISSPGDQSEVAAPRADTTAQTQGPAEAGPSLAAAPPAETVTVGEPKRDPGDEFYRMGLYPEAFNYWKAQADKGHTKAAYRLGLEYMDGKEGVTQRDYVAARRYLEVAALKGDGRAQFDLGTLYHYGYGVEKSLPQSAQWYRKAAERGHPQAQWTLATMLEKGEGVEKNPVEALKWYYIAADNGFRGAPVGEERAAGEKTPFAYEMLASQLTKNQAEEARILANDFTPLAE